MIINTITDPCYSPKLGPQTGFLLTNLKKKIPIMKMLSDLRHSIKKCAERNPKVCICEESVL